MSRRFISLLVIVGLVASQLAAIPHTHAGMSAAEQHHHDSVPHVHFGWAGHSAHQHGHSHAGHRHTHAKQPEKVAGKRVAGASNSKHLAEGVSISLHDAHAIFIPISTSSQNSIEKSPAAAASLLLALVAPILGLSFAGADPGNRALWHPPDKVLDGSDIYLTLRQLRN